MKVSGLLNRTCTAFGLLIAVCGFSYAQTKSFADAEAEIRTFDDFAAFTLSYDEARYVTIAEMKVEILPEKDDLRKSLKKFDWQMRSLFALKGIDAKPVESFLCIDSQSKRFLFSKENGLKIFLPDDEVDLGIPNRLSEVNRGKASERLCWEIGPDIITDLARAKTIAFQVGAFKAQIRADKLQVFKDYGKLLDVKL